VIERCDGCAWWTPFDADIQPGALASHLVATAERLGFPNVQVLRSALSLPPLGMCRLFECHEGDQVESESKLAVMRTGTGEASIATQADFGCVQWKARA
jgi:hypothetical protein